VIVGEKDTATPPAMAERLAAAIPGADLVVIKAAAHLPNIEQPEAFNATIGDFLRRHAGLRPQHEPGGRG
jgi:pimeloyl-ACP methyl ester carboxylesterase